MTCFGFEKMMATVYYMYVTVTQCSDTILRRKTQVRILIDLTYEC